jgi:hypothetical protein
MIGIPRLAAVVRSTVLRFSGAPEIPISFEPLEDAIHVHAARGFTRVRIETALTIIRNGTWRYFQRLVPPHLQLLADVSAIPRGMDQDITQRK